MGAVQPSDSLGRANKHRLHFRWHTHGCSVTPVILLAELTNVDYTGVHQMATPLPVKTLSESATSWHFDYFFIARLVHCFDAQLIARRSRIV